MNESIIGAMIPIVAIVSVTVYKIIQVVFEHDNKKMNRSNVNVNAALEKRVAELESRVVTLQDIVLGGEYEARRKVEHAMSHPIPPQAHTTPAQHAAQPSVRSMGE